MISEQKGDVTDRT